MPAISGGPPDWPALADAFRRAAGHGWAAEHGPATEKGPAVEHGELAAFRRRRWQDADRAAAWLAQDALPALDGKQAAALYRGAGGRQLAKFRANPIDEVRDAVDFLLYDPIKLESRFAECAVATGGFGLAGAGKEWPSYLLTLHDPTLFAPWSPHTERALRRLQLLPAAFRQGHPGLCYIDLLDILAHLAARLQLPDFRRVDEFCYFNGRIRRA